MQLSVEQNQDEKLRLMDLVKGKNEQLSTLENQLASLQVKAKPHKALREGQRELSAGQVARISKVAFEFSGDAIEAKRVAFEMSEEIRYGSLAKKSYRSGKPMSVEFAVNSACRLVRENRWQTPTQGRV